MDEQGKYPVYLRETKIQLMLAEWHREIPLVVGRRVREGDAKPNKSPLGRP